LAPTGTPEHPMRRAFTALLALLLTTAAVRAAGDGKVHLRWHGQSFFEIETPAGTRIVIDPHGLEAYGRISVSADLVLLSHFHSDHSRLDVVENAKKARVVPGLRDEKGDGKRVDWNVIDDQFRDVHLRTVGTFHDDAGGMQRGKNAVFVIETDGLRIVHLGDLGHKLTEAQVKRIGPVDVLLVPVGGVYTLNGSEAAEVVAQLKPKRYVVPMHYGTDVYEDLLSADEFLEDQKAGPVKKFATTNELVIDPKAPPPKEPTVAVLHWEKKGEK
jgi:L-ascorbate metabolism protein UlaG (beta-lactamase superfamily)